MPTIIWRETNSI